jgi:hypothetical protein
MAQIPHILVKLVCGTEGSLACRDRAAMQKELEEKLAKGKSDLAQELSELRAKTGEESSDDDINERAMKLRGQAAEKVCGRERKSVCVCVYIFSGCFGA